MKKFNSTDLKAIALHTVAMLIFWCLVFLLGRIIFVCVNSIKAVDLPLGEINRACIQGLIFDVSIWAYISIATCALTAILLWFIAVRRILTTAMWINAILGAIIIFLLPAEAVTYNAWSHHVDAGSLLMLADKPSLLFASTETWFEVLYIVLCGLMATAMLLTCVRLGRRVGKLVYSKSATTDETENKVLNKILTCVATLVIGGLLIIPLRGGVGIAPLNTGRAFFSKNIFANHIAINPVWNFMYSLKRLGNTEMTYHFVEDNKLDNIMANLNKKSGTFPHIFSSSRPNIVVILLESFSAHGISYLGGVNATPNIDSLRHTGVYFDNFFASADRSGKGLTAVMCGHPSLPTIRMIQYPSKTQNLPFVARSLRAEGYESQTFVYGGDLNFNNFNSLVNMAGFDNVITEDDFDSNQMSDKWGAHDEYTFERLLETMDRQQEPFFDFIFTLSSHEPYTVPMETVLEDKYLNSMAYTDRCLGNFMRAARQKEWFKNTVFVLVADHGHGGPENVGVADRRKFNIPLILTGGAVLPSDSLVKTYGSQTDIACTLLSQLGINTEDYLFSKNLLDNGVAQFAFFDFVDGFGYVTPNNYAVYDNQAQAYVRLDDPTDADTISGMAYLQQIAKDFKGR